MERQLKAKHVMSMTTARVAGAICGQFVTLVDLKTMARQLSAINAMAMATSRVAGAAPDENGADVGEACETNDDCTSGWCSLFAIPHVCASDDEKDGSVVKQLLEVFQ